MGQQEGPRQLTAREDKSERYNRESRSAASMYSNKSFRVAKLLKQEVTMAASTLARDVAP